MNKSNYLTKSYQQELAKRLLYTSGIWVGGTTAFVTVLCDRELNSLCRDGDVMLGVGDSRSSRE